MRASRTSTVTRHPPPATHRVIVTCLPAIVPVPELPRRAIATVTALGLPTTSVVPYFKARTRRSGRLIDLQHGHTSGGQLRHLNLDAMRTAAGSSASARWMLWQQVVAGTKPANPFWWYADRHRADPNGYPVARAQAEYLAQPRILAMTAYNALPNKPCPLPTSAVEALQTGYPTYVNLAWLAAVPSETFIPVTGGLLTPTDQRLTAQLAYLGAANAHLAQLGRDTALVAVATPR